MKIRFFFLLKHLLKISFYTEAMLHWDVLCNFYQAARFSLSAFFWFPSVWTLQKKPQKGNIEIFIETE